MIVDLREAPSALLQVAQWQFAEWGWMYPGQTFHDRSTQLREHFTNQLLPSTFVAFHDDFIAGTVGILGHDMEEFPALTPWLASLYVTPRFRDKGIGTKLVEHAERQAYDAGYDALFLYTGTALSYFLDRGWEVIHNMNRHGGQVAIMERDLTCYAPADEANAEPTDPPANDESAG